MDSYHVIVIGAGAAGLMAAGTAAMQGASVLLIEKNKNPGRKMLITGKGRCNITNNCEMSDFIKQTPVNGRFLYSAFSSFTNEDLINFLHRYGVKTKVERGGRIFPVSDRAKDVVDAFYSYVKDAGVKFLSDNVTDIIIENHQVVGVKTAKNKIIHTNSIIVTTGGKSYPQTGSTGDGYLFAQKAGHKVIEPKPSLVPLLAKEPWVSQLMGLSLKNVAITLSGKDKTLYRDFGEMLFTHYGVSGPMILSASSHLRDFDNKEYLLKIDLKPALDPLVLDKRILKDFEEAKNKDFINALDQLLPQKMIPVIVRLSGIPPRKKVHEITKEEREALTSVLKGMTLHIVGTRPIAEAIISSGGVDVKEINPKTMESKLSKNLYFAGEVLDVDAYTGGFNLQIAFSTGYLAGESAGRQAMPVLDS